MEPTCNFVQEYQPNGLKQDPVLGLHLSNCEDCQSQSYVLDDAR